MIRRTLLCLLLLSGAARAAEPTGYLDNLGMESQLRGAVAESPGLVTLTELTRSARGNPVWLVSLGEPEPRRPTVLLVAGLDGRHLVGTEVATRIVRQLADDPQALLELTRDARILVVPRLNTDSVTALLRKPHRILAGLPATRDADRDGLEGEDLADDLDADGIISQMRIQHPDGTLVTDGDGGAFLRPAKPEKGEAGAWMLLTEGADDDRDEKWNEEEDTGTNLARNFPSGYQWFGRNAGIHQVCEPESRALADLLVATPEIAAVIVFGPEDNLLATPSRESAAKTDADADRIEQPYTSIHIGDLPLLSGFGERYRKSLGVDTVPVPGSEDAAQGGFATFAYIARGRLALSTPVWTPELQLAMLKETDEEKKALKDLDAEVRREQRFRTWLQSVEPTWWLGWNRVVLPDRAQDTVEVGGFAPWAKMNPPSAVLDDLATTHTLLVKDVIASLPKLVIRGHSLKPLGGGLHELRLTVENTGTMPDVLVHGRLSKHVRPTRVEIAAGEGGKVLGAPGPVRLKRLEGNGGHEEVRRLLLLPPDAQEVTVRVVSETAGTISQTIAVEAAP